MEAVTVSIVEDLTEVRESLENIVRGSEDLLFLSDYPHEEMAEKNITLKQPPLVSMDINLQGTSGLACIRKIKAA